MPPAPESNDSQKPWALGFNPLAGIERAIDNLASKDTTNIRQVANSGTLGGTWSYGIVSGVKMAWLKGANQTMAASNFTTKTAVPPVSFFNTIDSVSATLRVSSLGGSGSKMVYVQDGYTTSSILLVYYNPIGSTDSASFDLLVVGT